MERKCGGRRKYIGLLVHDMRRSAAKRLRESGIHEKLIMDIGGWKTRSMFDRYTISDPEAMRRAMAVVTAPVPPEQPLNDPREHTGEKHRQNAGAINLLF